MKTSHYESYKLDEQIGYLLRLANQRHLAIFADLMEAGLTSVQFSTLFRLSQEPGQISQNALGRAVRMDAATTKGVVSRLIARELIKAENDPADKRRYLLSTTQQGRDLIEAVLPTMKKISEATIAPLSEQDAKQLMLLLGKIT